MRLIFTTKKEDIMGHERTYNLPQTGYFVVFVKFCEQMFQLKSHFFFFYFMCIGCMPAFVCATSLSGTCRVHASIGLCDISKWDASGALFLSFCFFV